MRYFRILAVLLSCSAVYFPTAEASSPQRKMKEIAGVPVYNYDQLGVQHGLAIKPRWNLVLKESTGVQSEDQMLSSMCEGSGMCVARGHPGEGGIAFVTLQGDESEIEKFITKDADAFEFLEPDLEVQLPPEESGGADDFDNEFLALMEIEGRHSRQRPCIDLSGVYGYPPVPFLGSYATATFTQNGCSGVFSQQGNRVEYTVSAQRVSFASGIFGTIKLPWKSGGRKALLIYKKGSTTSFSTYIQCPWRHWCSTPTPVPKPGDTPSPSPAPTPTRYWGLDRINQRTGRDGKYGCGLTGDGVHVYVMDTGINVNHRDFEGRAIPTVETHEGSVKACDPRLKDVNGMWTQCAKDVNGHGSHCAGTVGGKLSGVAKKVTLHACKVLSSRTGYTSRIAMGVDWVVTHAQFPAVMTMSLGADGKSNLMKVVIERAARQGIHTIVAAGNNATESCSQTPANVAVATTVSATGTNERFSKRLEEDDARASYSNYGACTDMWAPGHKITSVSHNSLTGVRSMSGTSMATPHVAGAAALMLQVNPGLSPKELDAALKSYATPDVVKDHRGGSNLFLYVTEYSTTTTTTLFVAPVRRRNVGSTRRRRRRRSRQGDARPTRRRGGKTRRRTKTRRRSSQRRRATMILEPLAPHHKKA